MPTKNRFGDTPFGGSPFGAKKKKPKPTPVIGERSGDIEKDDATEHKAIVGAVEKARRTVAANADQGYWCCVVFQSYEQMREFVERSGWSKYADETGIYIDGVRLAAELKIPLPKDERTNRVIRTLTDNDLVIDFPKSKGK